MIRSRSPIRILHDLAIQSLVGFVLVPALALPTAAAGQAWVRSDRQAPGAEGRFVPAFSLDEIVHTRVIREHALSPDGRHVAYGIGGYDDVRFGHDNNLRVVDVRTGESRKVTSDVYPKTDPRFSPDGSRLLYTSDSNLWYVDLSTGARTQVTASERSESAAAWSPDGSAIAFVSARRPEVYGERGGSPQVWVTDVRSLQRQGTRVGLRQVTDVDLTGLGDLQWSPDGRTLLFSAQWPYSVPEPDDTHVTARGIFRVPAQGGEATLLTPDDNFTDNFAPRWSPDGSRIAFISDRAGYAHLWVMNADGSDPTHFDWGPHDTPRQGNANPSWAPDGSRILVGVNRDGRFDLDIADLATGEIRTVARALDVGGGIHLGAGWASDDQIVYSYQNGWSPPDLFVQHVDEPRTSARQLTYSSHAWFREANFPTFERLEFETFDGLTLRGNLLKPRGLRPDDRLPALLWLHGGMYGHSYDAWQPFFHYLAARGYVVGMIDVRGSGGRGRQFREALALPGGYGPHYLEDLKAAVRHLQALPYVDPDRIGVFGKSHGGYRAVWLMTREPQLVRAGINLMGPTDRRAPYNNRGGRFHIGVSEEEDPQYYAWLSPVTQVERLQAPVMTIHTDRDRNVPAEMTEKFLAEQIRLGKEYEYVYYRDEAHGLADPVHILDHYRRILDFFDRHLRPSEDARSRAAAQ